MSAAGERRLGLALALSLALILVLGLQHKHRRSREADKALLQAYLQGPLSELLFGVSRSLPVLASGKPVPGGEAGEALQKSVLDLEALLKDKPQGPWVQSLGVVLESHRAYAALARRWKGMKGPALAVYLKDEEALRLKLCHQLDVLRDEAMDEQRWRRNEWLELNALLYSLRNPLEVDGNKP